MSQRKVRAIAQQDWDESDAARKVTIGRKENPPSYGILVKIRLQDAEIRSPRRVSAADGLLPPESPGDSGVEDESKKQSRGPGKENSGESEQPSGSRENEGKEASTKDASKNDGEVQEEEEVPTKVASKNDEEAQAEEKASLNLAPAHDERALVENPSVIEDVSLNDTNVNVEQAAKEEVREDISLIDEGLKDKREMAFPELPVQEEPKIPDEPVPPNGPAVKEKLSPLEETIDKRTLEEKPSAQDAWTAEAIGNEKALLELPVQMQDKPVPTNEPALQENVPPPDDPDTNNKQAPNIQKEGNDNNPMRYKGQTPLSQLSGESTPFRRTPSIRDGTDLKQVFLSKSSPADALKGSSFSTNELSSSTEVNKHSTFKDRIPSIFEVRKSLKTTAHELSTLINRAKIPRVKKGTVFYVNEEGNHFLVRIATAVKVTATISSKKRQKTV